MYCRLHVLNLNLILCKELTEMHNAYYAIWYEVNSKDNTIVKYGEIILVQS
jgi:hypothetical protein